MKYQETKSYLLDPDTSSILNPAYSSSSQEKLWLTYKNDKYGFEIKYPEGWFVSEQDVGRYFEGPGLTPHFYISNSLLSNPETVIGIHPQGPYSDAPFEKTQTQPSKIKIQNEREATDSVLSNGKVWETVITFKSVPSSWNQQYGSVRAKVKIYNQTTECVKANGRNSFEFNCDALAGLGDILVIDGNINDADRKTQEKILSTFRFLDVPASN